MGHDVYLNIQGLVSLWFPYDWTYFATSARHHYWHYGALLSHNMVAKTFINLSKPQRWYAYRKSQVCSAKPKTHQISFVFSWYGIRIDIFHKTFLSCKYINVAIYSPLSNKQLSIRCVSSNNWSSLGAFCRTQGRQNPWSLALRERRCATW